MLASFVLCTLAALQAGEVPKQPTAAAQLNYAKKVKSESRGTEGAERVAALQRALEAYAAVPRYWPDGGTLLAEAAFRRGEIHRGLGQAGAARGAFQEALDHGQGTDFVPRALLEIGHLHRREREMDAAVQAYQRVQALPGVNLRYLNDSREWTGKVQLDLAQWEAAASSFAAWAANAEGPVEVVRAADLEAKAWIGKGDLVRAENRIRAVQAQMEALASEPTKEAEELRSALERMKSPELLRKAREKQVGGAAAAVDEALEEP
ncbi:MAG: hypothetical protein EYC70_07435 [Planctomycetota bacterium]|nr:MAG: hypothetical protein EYC70_07435 [Planctomycetota bacterium]